MFFAQGLTRATPRNLLGFSLKALGRICLQAHSSYCLRPVSCGVGPRFPFPGWLSAGTVLFRAISGVLSPCVWNLSDVLLCHQPETTLCFEVRALVMVTSQTHTITLLL